MNEKEDQIVTYLANRDGAPERAESGHYYLTDLMDVAERTAAPELIAEVEAHCKECAACRMRIEAYRTVLVQGEEVVELPLEGSLLEFAVTPPAPRTKPQPNPSPMPQPVYQPGLTPLAHNPDRWQKLLSSLRTWFPAFTRHVGLPSDSIDELLNWVESQLPTIGPERFRIAFPRWVRAFARARGLPDELSELPDEVTREWFTVITFKQVLEEGDEYELPEQTRFRVQASHERFPTVEDFERYAPEQLPLHPDVVSYRRELAVQTRDQVAVSWAVIEQN